MQTCDCLRLVGKLADQVSYSGDWLSGAEAVALTGSMSERVLAPQFEWGLEQYMLDAPNYSETTRARSSDWLDHPMHTTAVLLRTLLRALGTEGLLLD